MQKITFLSKIFFCCTLFSLLFTGCFFGSKEQKAAPPAAAAPSVVPINPPVHGSAGSNVSGRLQITCQEIGAPLITMREPSKIISFINKGKYLFLARRSDDSKDINLTALELKGSTLAYANLFRGKHTLKFGNQTIYDVGISSDDLVYCTNIGLEAYDFSGKKLLNVEGSITDSKILILPENNEAIIYGNRSFYYVVLSAKNCKSSPYHQANKANVKTVSSMPRLLYDQGILYGGGHFTGNNKSVLMAFDSSGRTLRHYGSHDNLAEDYLLKVVDLAVTRDYLCAIDGFTLKFWRKSGIYLGSIHFDKLLSQGMGGARLLYLGDNKLCLLTYKREANAQNISLAFYVLTVS